MDFTLKKEAKQAIEGLGMSEETFFHFASQMDNKRIERDKNGTILIMSPVGMESGSDEANASCLVKKWSIEQGGGGHTYGSNTGFTLPKILLSAVRMRPGLPANATMSCLRMTRRNLGIFGPIS
ncbi:hypothetical protein BH10BAC3_BH10BAC3_02630 [soil metagenome]